MSRISGSTQKIMVTAKLPHLWTHTSHLQYLTSEQTGTFSTYERAKEQRITVICVHCHISKGVCGVNFRYTAHGYTAPHY